MNIYTLDGDPKVMGEKHEKYGYTFWGNVEEMDLPVMFNSQSGNVLTGDKLVAEEAARKTSAKGTDYMRLSKVKISGQAGEPTLTVSAKEEPKAPAAANDKYLKDTSDVPRSLVIELLKYYDVQTLYNSPKYEQMVKLAQSLNDDIMAMIEGNRTAQQKEVPSERRGQFAGSGKSSGFSSEMPEGTPRDIKDFSNPKSAADKVRASNPKLFKKELDPDEANDILAGMDEPYEG